MRKLSQSGTHQAPPIYTLHLQLILFPKSATFLNDEGCSLVRTPTSVKCISSYTFVSDERNPLWAGGLVKISYINPRQVAVLPGRELEKIAHF
jgi:hypothetical protein